MLTRLKVSGFKNLVDVDVRFGPFTCVAGINGVGKSNLFDAIRFLSYLTDNGLVEAAKMVRDESQKTGSIRDLFFRTGDKYENTMDFEAEMIVPSKGEDDLGQSAVATTTLLKYVLKLEYQEGDLDTGSGGLKILKEELVYIRKGEAKKHISFDYEKDWFSSACVWSRSRTSPFISTPGDAPLRIQLHQDGGSSGKPAPFRTETLPRTVLSSTTAEFPTALLARAEMRSWNQLQLEPTALRKSDDFEAPRELGMDGSHLAATLYRLTSHPKNGKAVRVFTEIANRLAELIGGVREISIDKDEKRQLLTLFLKDRNDTPFPAMALSDGTLRFLALAVLESDPEMKGVICLEEPENGIHPERIPAILELLQDIAVDTTMPIGDDNPLRQVIINTHSPAVVSQVPDSCLVIAETRELLREEQRSTKVNFSNLGDTWRAKADSEKRTVPIGKLLSYLNPIPDKDEMDSRQSSLQKRTPRRVIDRADIEPFIPGLLTPTEEECQ